MAPYLIHRIQPRSRSARYFGERERTGAVDVLRFAFLSATLRLRSSSDAEGRVLAVGVIAVKGGAQQLRASI
jgi:hypothetical protein